MRVHIDIDTHRDSESNGEAVALGIAAVALGISPFLSWVRVALLGDVDLFQLLRLGNESTAIPWILLALAAFLLERCVRSRTRRSLRTVCAVTGVVAGLITGDLAISCSRAAQQLPGLVDVGVGAYLGALACVALVVTPLLCAAADRRRGTVRQRANPVGRAPGWGYAWGALVAAAALALIPAHADAQTTCGLPLSAAFTKPVPLPDNTPPAAVQAQLAADNQTVTQDLSALNAAQTADARAAAQASAAQTLQDQAQNGDDDAADAADQVENDQDTVTDDQQTLSNDEGTLAQDQQEMQSDAAAGYDTSEDQASVTQDQQTIAQDTATLNTDTATLHSDQAAAKAQEAHAAATDRTSAAAQTTASTNATAAEGDDVATATTVLNDAQHQQTTDEQSWQDTYNGELQVAQAHDSRVTLCAQASQPRIGLAGGVLFLGALAWLGAVFLNKRRRNAGQIAT